MKAGWTKADASGIPGRAPPPASKSNGNLEPYALLMVPMQLLKGNAAMHDMQSRSGIPTARPARRTALPGAAPEKYRDFSVPQGICKAILICRRLAHNIMIVRNDLTVVHVPAQKGNRWRARPETGRSGRVQHGRSGMVAKGGCMKILVLPCRKAATRAGGRTGQSDARFGGCGRHRITINGIMATRREGFCDTSR